MLGLLQFLVSKEQIFLVSYHDDRHNVGNDDTFNVGAEDLRPML